MIHLEFGMLLCAGIGVRLRPLTDVSPKPLLHFLDRPIADYGLEALRRVGVGRIGVNAHHLPEQVADWLRRKDAGWGEDTGNRPQTQLVVEDQLLGTGGGAFGIWSALGSPRSTVGVINGDVVAEFPLEAMLKVHRRTGAVATMLMLPTVPGESAVFLDENDHFVAQVPSAVDVWTSPRYQPSRPATFGGVYLLEPEVFANLGPENSCLIRHGIGPLLARGEVVAGLRYDGFWADLGTPRRFLDATLEVLRNPDVFPSGPVRTRADLVYVADRKSLAPDVEFDGPAFVAAGAQIESGVRLGPGVVIGAGCRVAAGSTVRNAVLMRGAQVEGDLADRLVCGGSVVRV